MATIWDKVLKRIVGPVVDESVRQSVKENQDLEKGIMTQQVNGLGFPVTPGVGNVVSRLTPGIIRFSTLRQFSVYYPILRSCINYRKHQITSLKWDIGAREVVTDEKEKLRYKKDSEMVRDLLVHPTGEKHISMANFLNKIIEDLLVLDAIAVYRRKNRKGGVYGYLPIDATTIELLLNSDGTTPTPPQQAYMQKVAGMEVARLTTEELIYAMLNPRTNTPYGLSPVETLIITISTALKLSSYNLSYLTEGNIPEGFVELPKDVASNPDQLALWQNAWDAMFSGNPAYQRKIKFLPEGMKWNPVRKVEDMEFERFDKWLLECTCSVMDVPPQAIGFQFDRGKGATESELETGRERGLYPLSNLLKEIFDQIIQDDLGQKHLEFVWTNINPTDKKEEAEVFKTLVNTGGVSVDEWRIGQGMAPIGLTQYIMTPIGPVLAKDFIENPKLFTSQAGGNGQAPAPDKLSPDGKPGTTPKQKDEITVSPDAKPDTKTKVDAESDKVKKMADVASIEELQRWRKAAHNDLKQGRQFRDFKTDQIDYRTQNLIKSGLKLVTTKEDLDDLFSPFISQENEVIKAALDLYEEVNSIVAKNGNSTGATS